MSLQIYVYSYKTLQVSAKTVISEAGQIVSTAGIPKEGHMSVNLEPTNPLKSFVKAR